jgi:hypothetical protein
VWVFIPKDFMDIASNAAVRQSLSRLRKQRDLFGVIVRAMQVQEAIIEKDFWVCWVLDYLFEPARKVGRS